MLYKGKEVNSKGRIFPPRGNPWPIFWEMSEIHINNTVYLERKESLLWLDKHPLVISGRIRILNMK